ncbi:hypothetical protein LSAT2_007591 [Lamellibrachia satsuma]|nr:hypothetical protein LSAT2_007591 [Lamellibrachia satsuma]
MTRPARATLGTGTSAALLCTVVIVYNLACAINDKRTRAVNEVADGNEETLLKPLALVNTRLSETPRSHPGSVPAKLPPVKKQDGFYSDW